VIDTIVEYDKGTLIVMPNEPFQLLHIHSLTHITEILDSFVYHILILYRYTWADSAYSRKSRHAGGILCYSIVILTHSSLTIPPTWRRVMTMTSTSSLRLMYKFNLISDYGVHVWAQKQNNNIFVFPDQE